MKTLSQLASLIGGQVFGDPDLPIHDVGTLQSSEQGEITFLRSARYTDKLAESQASAAVVPIGFVPKHDLPHIQVENPEAAFEVLAHAFRGQLRRPRSGAHARAFISATARIGDDVTIYPGVFVGDHATIGAGSTLFPNCCILENCVIGERVQIHPNAVLYENTRVGDDTLVQAGAVIGGRGFGYKSDSDGHVSGPQIGYVDVGANVEVGCNSTVDRGTYGATRIGDGSKIDNLVQVGHNCQIGSHNMLCSQVGIAGSTTTGTFVVMAGQVGIGDHIAIGDRVTLGAQSGVMHDIGAGQTLVGTPALPVRKMMQVYAVQSRLPELRSSIKELNRKLDAVQPPVAEQLDPAAPRLAEASRAA